MGHAAVYPDKFWTSSSCSSPSFFSSSDQALEQAPSPSNGRRMISTLNGLRPAGLRDNRTVNSGQQWVTLIGWSPIYTTFVSYGLFPVQLRDARPPINLFGHGSCHWQPVMKFNKNCPLTNFRKIWLEIGCFLPMFRDRLSYTRKWPWRFQLQSFGLATRYY